MKSKCTPWVRVIVVVVLGFCLASCAKNSPPVPEAEYSTKIGHPSFLGLHFLQLQI